MPANKLTVVWLIVRGIVAVVRWIGRCLLLLLSIHNRAKPARNAITHDSVT